MSKPQGMSYGLIEKEKKTKERPAFVRSFKRTKRVNECLAEADRGEISGPGMDGRMTNAEIKRLKTGQSSLMHGTGSKTRLVYHSFCFRFFYLAATDLLRTRTITAKLGPSVI